ncbi:UDP-N-acetylmuramyl-tripeptide synthetase [Nannocystis pusilla]|uniref:UDP-N-acetylmuramyl-tripeptide synthetase n=1 Tax=Nannocystis pusilla TaxID=889268 RepID=A0A9X3EQ50_9BACT|nr:UDP-N-acetylmuramyl-tripeptide synthetase [Nannocystis pusilla]
MSDPRLVPAAAPWAEDMRTFGVTGTNGKTSTTTMLAAIVRAAGQRVFAATTLDYSLDGVPLPVERSWQGFLAAAEQSRAAGARHAAVEITSQSLARGYAKRWRFDWSVFTNLSPDHFKSHGSWEHYLASKAQLFVHTSPGGAAILNARDPAALLLDQVTPADVRRVWYGYMSRGPCLMEHDLEAVSVRTSVDGTALTLAASPLAEALGGALQVAYVGEVFAENALAAAAAALSAGLPAAAVRAGLASCPVVPGRFEVLGRSPVAVVDYAHTPDALERTCATARALAGEGRVIVVFGAGGDTDAGKREPMGEAVGRAADIAVLTTDNPRREEPRQIAAHLRAGLTRGGRARIVEEADRLLAIGLALELAQPGDVVVVAGKGHESGQTIGDETLPFSDRAVVQELLGLEADDGAA